MIRPYKKGDEHELDFNEFSDHRYVSDELDDDDWFKFTLDDCGVKVIMCFKEIKEQATWILFALFSKSLKPMYGRELKQILEDQVRAVGARRVVTYSRDIPIINRMHQFLGFIHYDKRIIDGALYNGWEALWD